jgi:hypothetical protein
MSRYLIDRIAADPNTEVVSDTEVRAREDHRFEVAVALAKRVRSPATTPPRLTR